MNNETITIDGEAIDKISQDTFVMKIPLIDEVSKVFELDMKEGSLAKFTNKFGSISTATMQEVETNEIGIFYI